MAAAGVAVDLSRVYVAHNKLQNAVDAAALAGSLQLPDDPDVTNGKVKTAVTANLALNDPEATGIDVTSGGATRSVGCQRICISASNTLSQAVAVVAAAYCG